MRFVKNVQRFTAETTLRRLLRKSAEAVSQKVAIIMEHDARLAFERVLDDLKCDPKTNVKTAIRAFAVISNIVEIRVFQSLFSSKWGIVFGVETAL